MLIRTAQEADIPRIQALLVQVCNVHQAIRPDLFRRDAQKYDAPALAELLQDPERPIFVAVEDGEVVGYCFCQLRDYRDAGAFRDRRELYIDDLCVDEQCRGRGIATALYAHVTGYARSIGCAYITLNVWQGNGSAMSFYEHAGLKPRSITMEMPLEVEQC